uniref:C2H2-type domain-containing protein n=1 Tax=Lygus hesperus TaxID=30085 RepID=A0A0A9YCW7_LYGHE
MAKNSTSSTIHIDETEAVYSCTLCKKTFRSVQTLQTHIRSTAHLIKKEQRILARDSEVASMLTTTSLGSVAIGLHRRHHAKTKKTVLDVVDGRNGDKDKGDEQHLRKQTQNTPVVPLDDREKDVSEIRCMLCGLLSDVVEANELHLSHVHDFHIPMRLHCTDVTGLLAYLARKVNGLMCLVCNEKTRHLASLEALRNHMK